MKIKIVKQNFRCLNQQQSQLQKLKQTKKKLESEVKKIQDKNKLKNRQIKIAKKIINQFYIFKKNI